MTWRFQSCKGLKPQPQSQVSLVPEHQQKDTVAWHQGTRNELVLWNVSVDQARKDVGKAGYVQLLSISCLILCCFLGTGSSRGTQVPMKVRFPQ